MSRPALEVADIFRGHGPAWRQANADHVSLDQLKVMSAIEDCRTAALGGHVLRCENDKCSHTQIAYNSCLMGKSSNGELVGDLPVPPTDSADLLEFHSPLLRPPQHRWGAGQWTRPATEDPMFNRFLHSAENPTATNALPKANP